ncbi:MAG: LysR family transcriptional regulator [Moorellales bacterium]
MTLHQLRVLCTIIQEGSLQRAATVLCVSQPTISAQVKALERELGCELLKRRPGSKRVEATAAGEILYRGALEVFRTLDLILSDLKGLKAAPSFAVREVRVISDLAIGLYVLPSLIKEFKNSCATRIMVTPLPHVVLPQVLQVHNYDLAVVPRTIPTPHAVKQFSFTEPLAAVASPKLMPLSAREPFDLACLPLVVAPEGSVVRSAIDSYFKRIGIRPHIVLEFNHPEAIKSLIESVPVGTITHRVSVQDSLEAGRLVELPLPQELPQVEYKIVRSRFSVEKEVEGLCRFLRNRLEIIGRIIS